MALRHTDVGTTVARCTDGLDTTARLRGACLQLAREALARGVRGAIVKSASPSCAADGALLFPEHGGSPRPDGVGVLVQALRGLVPALPVIDESAFEDAGRRAAFFRQMGA